MKKILFGLLMVATIASCKKSDKISCEVSVAGIAGSYKITKATVTVGIVPEQDITTSLFDACQLNGVYQLKADKTVVYTEIGITCSGSGTGTWDIVSGNIVMAFPSGGGIEFPSTAPSTKVSGWDCTTLTLSEVPAAGQTFKYTFTKQ